MASAVTRKQEVRAQLERIVASTPFAGSHRSQRFLRYVVENSLEDAHESLKEYAIAIEVFERNSSYDPSIDATVRVEAGRLRSRLREYYADAGRNDPFIIDMPKGQRQLDWLPGHLHCADTGRKPSKSGRSIRRYCAAAEAQLPPPALPISAIPENRGGIPRNVLRWSLVLTGVLYWATGNTCGMRKKIFIECWSSTHTQLR